MRLRDDSTVGQRIAHHRKRRGMTQEVLCGLVGGKSIEWLRQIESGTRDVDKLSTIVAVAEALKIAPSDLLPGPFRSTSNALTGLGSAPEAVPEIQAAMLRYDGIAGLLNFPNREVSARHLKATVERAFVCSQTERWSDMAPLVPNMIEDAWHLVRNAKTDEERRE